MINCPNCNREIPKQNINIQANIAQCDACNTIHKISNIVSTEEDSKHKLSKKLNNSKFKVEQKLNGETIISYPKKGITATDIPIFFFMIFWFGFITFWTWGASQGSLLFAAFSIPFWGAGFFILGKTLYEAFSTTTVFITKSNWKITHVTKLFTKNISINPKDIQKIEIHQFTRKQKNGSSYYYAPAILTTNKTYKLYPHASTAEHEWFVNSLNNEL